MKKVLSTSDLEQIELIKSEENIPKHIAIIMDGNGRWAKKRGLPRVSGHKSGIETVRRMVQACSNLGVKYLTLYTFSTENWKRPKQEVSTLMRLIVKSLRNETKELHENNIRLTSIGCKTNLPEEVQRELRESEELTVNNDKMTLNLALSYSGRREITDAVNLIVNDVKNGKIIDEISEETFSNYLYTKELPDPDLLIRSGGEIRVSNFLLWQIAYSEMYITQKLWPEFTVTDLITAVKDFQQRERRFGLVSEQLS